MSVWRALGGHVRRAVPTQGIIEEDVERAWKLHRYQRLRSCHDPIGDRRHPAMRWVSCLPVGGSESHRLYVLRDSSKCLTLSSSKLSPTAHCKRPQTPCGSDTKVGPGADWQLRFRPPSRAGLYGRAPASRDQNRHDSKMVFGRSMQSKLFSNQCQIVLLSVSTRPKSGGDSLLEPEQTLIHPGFARAYPMRQVVFRVPSYILCDSPSCILYDPR